MKLSTLLATGGVALAATLLSAPLEAAPILGSGGSGLQSMGTPLENGSRYWDGDSWDSTSTPNGGVSNPCNAGSLALGISCGLSPAAQGAAHLAGITTNTFTLGEHDAQFQAWGNADGSADMNYGFQGGGVYDFRMLGEFTYDWNVNEIGWYEIGNPSARHTIFSSSATTGSTAQVYIPTNFGFYYLNTSGNGEVYYTQSMFNTWGHNQQFAAFQYNDYTILGVEDIFSNIREGLGRDGTSDYDYNDVMFGFRSASVPEPGTLLLLGMGLAGVAATRRRAAR